jgi:hypothetical protein
MDPSKDLVAQVVASARWLFAEHPQASVLIECLRVLAASPGQGVGIAEISFRVCISERAVRGIMSVLVDAGLASSTGAHKDAWLCYPGVALGKCAPALKALYEKEHASALLAYNNQN